MNETPQPESQPGWESTGESLPAPYAPQPSSAEPAGGAPGFIPTAARRRGPRWPWLVGAAAAVALILALGFAVGVAISAAHAANEGRAITLFQRNGPQRGGPWDGRGHGGIGGMGLTVSKVSGQTITATDHDGGTVTIHVTSTTTYQRASKAVSLSAVTTGESIGVMGQRNSDGSVNATRVVIMLPGFRGQVASVSGSTITVSDRQGTQTIHVSSATTYTTDGGAASSLSAVVKGAEIEAVGSKNSDGSLNAEAVEIETPHASGKVSAVSGTTITVTDPRGTQTIHVSASTRYDTVTMGANGSIKTASSLSAVKAGVFIMAEGSTNSDGSLSAQTVYIVTAPAGGSWNGGPHDGGPIGAPSGAQGPSF